MWGIGLVGSRLFTSYGRSEIAERDLATGAVIKSIPSPGGEATALAGRPVPEPPNALLAALAATLVTCHSAPRRRPPFRAAERVRL